MKIIIHCLLILVVFSHPLQGTAKFNLDRLIQNQQDIDKSTRLENSLEKKDVYSSVDKSTLIQSDLPVEENCLPIEHVIIENDFLINTDLKKIIDNAAGHCLGAQGIQKLAYNIQDYLIKSGYITTRIQIPSQDLTSRKLILSVVPGRIENIIFKEDVVRSWVLPFKREDILNLRDIEQGLELIQRIPLAQLKIDIEPGSRDGYSNVVIDVTNPGRWNTRVWLNNWGDKSTGKILANGAGYLYNLAGISDLFYLSGTTQVEDIQGGYQSISAYYSIPFGYWEYELFYSQSQSKQHIDINHIDLNYQGRNTYLNFKGSRTIYRDQNKKLTLSAALLRRKANYQLNDITLVMQKRDMTNIRFELNYKQQFSTSLLNSTLFYQRFVQWFGAQKTPDMNSRDVSPQSHILNLDLNYLTYLNLRLFDAYYHLRFGAQYSPTGLTLQDAFSIGNRWNVRGFENSAELNGNNGFYLQNSLNVNTGIKDMVGYVGIDYGQVWNKNSDDDQGKLIGATLGLNGSIYALNYDLSLSTPLMHPANLFVDKCSLNFNLSYQL